MSEAAENGKAGRRRFLLRKLHSLSGVIPVGGFLVLHLWTTSAALRGQERFERAMRDSRQSPYTTAIEVVVVLLPLLFHALYGIKLSFEPRQNTNTYPYSRNWMYAAQRLTGMLSLAFIIWHLSEYWIPTITGELTEETYYPALCQNLSTTRFGIPLPALAYVFGIAATVFHFANGLWGFCASWGITASRRAQRTSATIFGVAGVALFMIGANTAIYFATGARIAVFGVPAHTRTAQLTKTCADLAPAVPSAAPAPPPLPAAPK